VRLREREEGEEVLRGGGLKGGSAVPTESAAVFVSGDAPRPAYGSRCPTGTSTRGSAVGLSASPAW